MAHCRPSVITSIDIPNFAEIGKTFCGRMDVRTYLLTDISDPFYVIRSTRRSRPHNALNSKLIKVTLRQRICYFWQTTVYKECGFWRLFVERFALCYLSVVCLSVTLGPLVANGWMDQEETWHGGRPRRRRHRVTWGPISPQKGGTAAPTFRPMYCGQTAGWIKTPFGTEVGLSQGHIVLDGTQRPQKGTAPHIFGLCLWWPNGCMDQDATRDEDRRWPRQHCVRWGPNSPRNGAQSPPIFGSCLLWPNGWFDQDATSYRTSLGQGTVC